MAIHRNHELDAPVERNYFAFRRLLVTTPEEAYGAAMGADCEPPPYGWMLRSFVWGPPLQPLTRWETRWVYGDVTREIEQSISKMLPILKPAYWPRAQRPRRRRVASSPRKARAPDEPPGEHEDLDPAPPRLGVA